METTEHIPDSGICDYYLNTNCQIGAPDLAGGKFGVFSQ
jgi:hypothetical protein